jgi:hypothetical protein
MPRDPRDEALDKIQDIANSLSVAYDLPAEVCNYLDVIEALARHRDNPSCVDTKVTQLCAKANRQTQ